MNNILEEINLQEYNGPNLDLNYFKYKFSIGLFSLLNGACRDVKFLYIVDGDTIAVSYDNKEYRVRLLVVDTPETVKRSDKWGIVAKEFTKTLIEMADKVVIQLDNSSDKLFDEYGRMLAWVWIKIDGEYQLLQSLLVKNGLATVKYIDHPSLMYLEYLKEQEKHAKKNKLVIWGDKQLDPYWDYENNRHKEKYYVVITNEGYVNVNDYELEIWDISNLKYTRLRSKDDATLLSKRLKQTKKYEYVNIVENYQ